MTDRGTFCDRCVNLLPEPELPVESKSQTLGINTTSLTTTPVLEKDLWGTPIDWFWLDLQPRYHFQVDAAAADDNYMLVNYWTPEDDGLAQDWRGKRIFCNPPYSRGNCERWVRKAYETSMEDQSDTGLIFMLLPPATDVAWFHDYIKDPLHVEYDFYRGRLKFRPPAGRTLSADGATQGNLFAIFRPRWILNPQTTIELEKTNDLIEQFRLSKLPTLAESLDARFAGRPLSFTIPSVSDGLLESYPAGDISQDREWPDLERGDVVIHQGEVIHWTRLSFAAGELRVPDLGGLSSV